MRGGGGERWACCYWRWAGAAGMGPKRRALRSRITPGSRTTAAVEHGASMGGRVAQRGYKRVLRHLRTRAWPDVETVPRRVEQAPGARDPTVDARKLGGGGGGGRGLRGEAGGMRVGPSSTDL